MACVPVIDEDACLAHGDCEEMVPSVFRVENTAVVIGTAPAETLLPVAEACPAGAISLIDDQSGEQVYP
jgi:ferredoxin